MKRTLLERKTPLERFPMKRKPKRFEDVTPEVRREVMERSGGRCEAVFWRQCGALLWFPDRCPNPATDLDHIKNRGMGGTRKPTPASGLQALCRDCHIEKTEGRRPVKSEPMWGHTGR